MYQSLLNRSRNDKFILVLDLPKSMKDKFDSVLEQNYKIDPLQISIFGSPVPAASVPSINLPYGGQVYKGSSMSRPAYQPLTIKFLVDNGYRNYWILWNWLNLFNDAKTSSSDITIAPNSNNNKVIPITNPMSNYTSNFNIYGLDEFNNKIISFTYTHCFPTSLSEINFSNQDPSEITSIVTFEFNQLQVDLISNNNKINC
jgi:hypothetical protein